MPINPQETRQVYEDFSGGIVTDNPLRIMSNECLQIKNATVTTKGGFEKRKGSEILSSGVGVNTENDIWAVIIGTSHTQVDLEVPVPGASAMYDGYYFCEGKKGTSKERDTIVYVEFDNSTNMDTFYNDWVTKGTNEGWITDYEYGDWRSWWNEPIS